MRQKGLKGIFMSKAKLKKGISGEEGRKDRRTDLVRRPGIPTPRGLETLKGRDRT